MCKNNYRIKQNKGDPKRVTGYSDCLITRFGLNL
jgi:hypothetical protein